MLSASNRYHVVCSKHFTSHFILSLSALVVAFFVIQKNPYIHDLFANQYEQVKVHMMVQATNLKWWSVVSLLSSACCALQLILNLFSVGCAGFNTILGPLRPYLLSCGLVGQVYMWSQIKLDSQYPQAVQATLVTVGISFMPEYLYIYNQCWASKNIAPTAKTTTSSTAMVTLIEIQLENMGCIACVTTITNVMLGCPGVTDVQVRLDDNAADVSITDACNVQEMCAQVTDIGFPATCAARLQSPAVTKARPTTSTTCTTPTTPTSPTTPTTPNHATTWVFSIVAGLLSSSCCALQLGLNVLSTLNVVHIGCAGFNKVLGPLRTVTRSVSMGWLVLLWGKHWYATTAVRLPATPPATPPTTKTRNRLLLSSTVTLVLMFLPELLRLSGGPALAPPTDNQIAITYNVPNMGCEACENNVRRILNKQNGVIDSAVDFEGGKAVLLVAREWNFNVDRLKNELIEAGYGLMEEGMELDVDVEGGGKGGSGMEEEEVCEECEAEDLDW